MLSFEQKASNQASRELRKKLGLEKTATREVRSLFRQMRDDFRIHVASTGSPQDASQYTAAWTNLLNKHYARVQKEFSKEVKYFNCLEFKQMDEEQDIQELLAFSLLTYRTARAPRQSGYIVETSRRNMNASVNEARLVQSEQGLPTDNRSIAAVSSAILGRKFSGRVENIVTLETQDPSENTKKSDAMIRSGRVPNSVAGQRDPVVERVEATKSWGTVGDRRVRPTHVSANGQTVDIDDSFIVGTSFLDYPGDTSHGAPLGEVSGCRCSGIYRM